MMTKTKAGRKSPFRSSSIKTRIETKRIRCRHIRHAELSDHLPLKQGLKLLMEDDLKDETGFQIIFH